MNRKFTHISNKNTFLFSIITFWAIFFDSMIIPSVIQAFMVGELTLAIILDLGMLLLLFLLLIFNIIGLIGLWAIGCKLYYSICCIKKNTPILAAYIRKIKREEPFTREDFKWILLHLPKNQKEYWKYMIIFGGIIAFVYCLIVYWDDNSWITILVNILLLLGCLYKATHKNW